jgi:hypothetical protein
MPRKIVDVSAPSNGLNTVDGTIICNMDGRDIARSVYRIISYAHDESAIGYSDEDQ